MTQETYWVGLDLGLQETHVCILDDAGFTLREQACETSHASIADALSIVPSEGIRLIAAEAGTATHLVRKLLEMGLPVALFETRKTRRFLALRRNKTDASDARGLADMARLGQNTVSRVYLKSPECQQLRSQIVMRHNLTKLRMMAEGSLRSRLGLHGRRLRRTRSAAKLREAVVTALAQINADEGVDLTDDVLPLLETCERLRNYLDDLDRKLLAKAKKHPVCQNLMGVTGVGPISALSFYSAIEDPNRFKRTSDVAPYLGLVPRRHQSGAMSHTRGITKTGSKLTRMHLVNAAMIFSARGPDSDLKAWGLAIQERGGRKRARIALARKLSIVLLTIWKTGASFDPFPSKCN